MTTVHNDIALLFREGHSKFSRLFARILTAENLSLPQYALLNHLAGRKTLKMTEISRELSITKPAVTNLVDRLEAGAYLRRVPHPKDRRVHLLEILPKGLRVTQNVQAQALGICLGAVRKLGERDARVLVRFYGLLHESVDAALAKKAKAR